LYTAAAAAAAVAVSLPALPQRAVLLLLQVYVLKVINMDMGNQQVRRQVTREVRALDGARHPHVVSYHQSFFAEGAVTILMEFMDGGTLWDLLQKVRLIWQGCVLCCAVLSCVALYAAVVSKLAWQQLGVPR
jgi:hypothetical protein